MIGKEYKTIAKWIPHHSKVLDLGCGKGDLLKYLVDKNKIFASGVEIKTNMVLSAMNKGVPIIQKDLFKAIKLYPDHFFDYVILSRTLGQLVDPYKAILEMLRVARFCIISFVNYGFFKNRLQFLFKGKKPVNKALPYEWGKTPDIHPLSIEDFRLFCQKENYRIHQQIFLSGDWENSITFLPNLRTGYALYMISQNS